MHHETEHVKEEVKPKSALKKKSSIMATEEDCEMEETLSDDTPSIASLDAGSTFDSTNNENALTKTLKAKSPITSKTNVKKRLVE